MKFASRICGSEMLPLILLSAGTDQASLSNFCANAVTSKFLNPPDTDYLSCDDPGLLVICNTQRHSFKSVRKYCRSAFAARDYGPCFVTAIWIRQRQSSGSEPGGVEKGFLRSESHNGYGRCLLCSTECPRQKLRAHQP